MRMGDLDSFLDRSDARAVFSRVRDNGTVRSSSSIVFYMPDDGVLKPATIVNA